MADASYTTDPLDFLVLNRRPVRDLDLAECEAVVAQLNRERDVIMAQIRRHDMDPSSRPPGWRVSAQAALTWKKRVRTAINVRAQELKMGPKARAKRGAAAPAGTTEITIKALFAIVPVEPTPDMIRAGHGEQETYLLDEVSTPISARAIVAIYRAMLAAAPRQGGEHAS